MMVKLPPICMGCAHFIEVAMPHIEDYAAVAGPKTGRCDAFPYPQSIPAPIWQNAADHRKPYAGDRGIHFEPGEKKAAQYAALLFDEKETPV